MAQEDSDSDSMTVPRRRRKMPLSAIPCSGFLADAAPDEAIILPAWVMASSREGKTAPELVRFPAHGAVANID